jgi:hypothetical protein
MWTYFPEAPMRDDDIFADYQAGMTQKTIGRKYGLTQAGVSRILKKNPAYRVNRFHRESCGKWPPERIALVILLYLDGCPLAEVARQVKSNSTHVRAQLRKAGVMIRHQSEAQTGKWNPVWNGGRTIDKHGYILVLSPEHPHRNSSGYVREHRLVVERVIGRLLDPGEVVHHIDRNHNNNDPSNLQLFSSNGEHLAFELLGKCPKWTAEGRARTLEGARRPRPQCRKNLQPKTDDSESQSHSDRIGT